MNYIIILLATLLPFAAEAGNPFKKIKDPSSGIFQLGIRGNISLFNDGDWNSIERGVGGQFRIRFLDRVNSEWYADYITGYQLNNRVHRSNVHVGWSVMFYLLKEKKDRQRVVNPYLIAGHCFDFTTLHNMETGERTKVNFMPAVQMGLGTQFNVTDKLDFSLTGQYMAHLGKHLEAHEEEGEIHFDKHSDGFLEGHLLITITANFRIADMW